MPICDECKKNVQRRVTYQRADVKRKVCQTCADKLSSQEYMLLCDTIMNTKKKRSQ